MGTTRQLQEILEPWVRVETWHTLHPLDQDRFYKSLHCAFAVLGPRIGYGEFFDVIKTLSTLYQPGWTQEFRNTLAEKFAGMASEFGAYEAALD